MKTFEEFLEHNSNISFISNTVDKLFNDGINLKMFITKLVENIILEEQNEQKIHQLNEILGKYNPLRYIHQAFSPSAAAGYQAYDAHASKVNAAKAAVDAYKTSKGLDTTKDWLPKDAPVNIRQASQFLKDVKGTGQGWLGGSNTQGAKDAYYSAKAQHNIQQMGQDSYTNPWDQQSNQPNQQSQQNVGQNVGQITPTQAVQAITQIKNIAPAKFKNVLGRLQQALQSNQHLPF